MQLHIGVVTTGYPHERDPVAGAFVRELDLALLRRGHRVSVLCAQRYGVGAPLGLAHERAAVRAVRYGPDDAAYDLLAHGGAPARLREKSLPIRALAPAMTLALARAAARHLGACDVVLSHFVLPSALALAPLRIAGRLPLHVAVAHGTDARWLAQLPSPLQRLVARGSDALWVTHPEAVAPWHPALRAHRALRTAPMGFAPAPEFSPAERARVRRAYGVADDEVCVLSVARCVPVKGLDVLVDAVSPSIDRVRVLVAGDGPQRVTLEARARKHAPSVRFLGAVDAAERDRLLRAADLFVLPSRPVEGHSDGAPVALLEALGAGLASIASRTGGLAATAGSAAMLVSPGDSQALREAIAHLASDESARRALASDAVLYARAHTVDARAAWLDQWISTLAAGRAR